MRNPRAELIWAGRIHLGDEPGIYGNGIYAGLSFELPFMLTRFTEDSAKSDVKLVLQAEDVLIYTQWYPGHRVTITGYEPVPSGNPGELPKWREVKVCPKGIKAGEACQWRLTKDNLTLEFDPPPRVNYFSLCIRVDTMVAAGLYDDFVVTRLSIKSSTHYASLGFDYKPL